MSLPIKLEGVPRPPSGCISKLLLLPKPRSFLNKYNMPNCKVHKPDTKLFKCMTGVLKWFQGLITYTLLGKKAVKFSMGKVILSGKIKLPALQAANKIFSLLSKAKRSYMVSLISVLKSCRFHPPKKRLRIFWWITLNGKVMRNMSVFISAMNHTVGWLGPIVES